MYRPFGFAWVIEEEASEAEIWLTVNGALLNLSTDSGNVQFLSHTSPPLAEGEQLPSVYVIAQRGTS